MTLHKNISVVQNPFALASNTSKTETFVCTTHKLSFTDQDSVIQHLYDYHYGDPNTVCPICTARGGNPNYKSSDIIGHINVRHIGYPNYRPPQ